MFKNLSIRAVLTTALCVFFALFLVTGIAVYQQLTSNRTSIEVMLDTNLVRANAVDDAGSELLRARLVLLAAQTTLLAVSYTHLDVYKRQMLMRPWVRSRTRFDQISAPWPHGKVVPTTMESLYSGL